MAKAESRMTTQDERDEKVLKALLARADTPSLPAGAAERLMKAVTSTPQETNVIAFHPLRRSPLIWAGLALAASLAAGIVLGSQQSFDSLLPGFDSAFGLDIEVPSGLDVQDDATDSVT
jgi:hypothetical protein